MLLAQGRLAFAEEEFAVPDGRPGMLRPLKGLRWRRGDRRGILGGPSRHGAARMRVGGRFPGPDVPGVRIRGLRLRLGAHVVTGMRIGSEEHPADLQSLMRTSYVGFRLKKKKCN